MHRCCARNLKDFSFIRAGDILPKESWFPVYPDSIWKTRLYDVPLHCSSHSWFYSVKCTLINEVEALKMLFDLKPPPQILDLTPFYECIHPWQNLVYLSWSLSNLSRKSASLDLCATICVIMWEFVLQWAYIWRPHEGKGWIDKECVRRN